MRISLKGQNIDLTTLAAEITRSALQHLSGDFRKHWARCSFIVQYQSNVWTQLFIPCLIFFLYVFFPFYICRCIMKNNKKEHMEFTMPRKKRKKKKNTWNERVCPNFSLVLYTVKNRLQNKNATTHLLSYSSLK